MNGLILIEDLNPEREEDDQSLRPALEHTWV